MKTALRSFVVLLAAFTAASTADPDGDELFQKVRSKVLDNISRVPRYTCVQTVDRAQYLPLYGKKPLSCAAFIAARKELISPGYLVWRDRLRLDVAVLSGEETFSWAGAQQFETTHMDELVPSGTTGNGEFASFLTSVFGGAPDDISFEGPSLFRFNVPLANSHFTVHSHGSQIRIIAYHGSFRVDPENAELKRLTIQADQFPPEESTCSVEDVMSYTAVKIGAGDFLLPSVATMDILYSQGSESVNETRYSGCREYMGESTIRFGDDAVSASAPDAPDAPVPDRLPQRPLPSGLRFHIGLVSVIRSDTAAAGDAVTGVVLDDVRDDEVNPGRGIVARANDLVHGRIVQLEQFNSPEAVWVVAIRFETLQHAGTEQPISLKSLDGDPFFFRQAGNLMLDQSFQSEWVTR